MSRSNCPECRLVWDNREPEMFTDADGDGDGRPRCNICGDVLGGTADD